MIKKKKNLIARAKCNKSLKVETSLKEDNIILDEVKKKKKKAFGKILLIFEFELKSQ